MCIRDRYHSHPFDVDEDHDNFFFSSTDLSTQLSWQNAEDPQGNPFLAIVLDPLRSAAKNHQSVTVVVDRADYGRVADQISKEGDTSLEVRRELAVKVYSRTSAYDVAIAQHLANVYAADQPETALSDKLVVRADKTQDLRYGENPHQRAALYGRFGEFYEQLHGKALSYNNILDLTAAAHLILEYDADPPTLAILKHTNPCGLGQAEELSAAWDKAYATDQQAPFGGIIACNTTLKFATAEQISEIFTEVIVAPDFSEDALELLQQKKNLRLVKLKLNPANAVPWDVRSVGAESFLVQERDLKKTSAVDLEVVTERHPSEDELKAMLFGWRAVKHLKSNAILYAGKDRTLGVGAGQMSRVDSSRIAVWKAGEAGLDLKTTSYPLWTIDDDTIARLVEEGGIIAPKGDAGSVIMFHSNLVHGSPSNMSPFDRTIVYLSLCHVDNHIRRFKRAEWIAHRDFTPIECLRDDCLRTLGGSAAAE